MLRCNRLVREVQTKIHKVKSRHTIYLRKEFVEDSAFPFKVGQLLSIRIEGDKVIIERAKK